MAKPERGAAARETRGGFLGLRRRTVEATATRVLRGKTIVDITTYDGKGRVRREESDVHSTNNAQKAAEKAVTRRGTVLRRLAK